MTTIDLSPQLNEIRRRYPEWWRSDDAIQQLRALWGGTDCNQHGVMEESEVIRIQLDGKKMWHGTVQIAKAPNGWYAVDVDYSYSLGGGGSSPSVWNRTAYTSRDEALEAGIASLIEIFQSIGNPKTSAPKSQIEDAARMIEALKAHLNGARQLTLF